MKKNEYKTEVDSLRLSDQFKENLKAKMLEEYEKGAEGEPEITVSGPGRFSKKYARYAAIAAAFVIVASTVSVLGVKGIRAKNTDAAVNESENQAENAAAQPPQADVTETYIMHDDFILETESEDEEVAPIMDDNEMTAEDDGEAEVMNASEEEDIPPADTVPATDYDPNEQTKYSPNASENYDGDYNGDDYINKNVGSPDGLTETEEIADVIYFRPQIIEPKVYVIQPAEQPTEPTENDPSGEVSPTEATETSATESNTTAPELPASTGAKKTPAPGGGNNEIAESESVDEDSIEDAPLPLPGADPEEEVGGSIQIDDDSAEESDIDINEPEMPEEAPVEEVDMPVELPPPNVTYAPEQGFDDSAPMEMPETEVDMPEPVEDRSEDIAEPFVVAVNPMTSSPEPYLSYYDYRDSNIGEGSEMGLIRFSVVKAYSESELSDVAAGLLLDAKNETLYKVKVSYDYLNSEDVSETLLLKNVGSYSRSLDGEPVLSGEYIARVTLNGGDGVLAVDNNMLYKIYSVNGLDIAYHVISPLGKNIDPGDTNMGLSDEEQGVYTTSSNNPEKYVHKSAINELTRYLKRNLAKIDVKAIDLSTCAKAPYDSLSATYQAGGLRAELIEPGLSFPDDGGVKALLEDMGADIGEKTCSVITKDGSKAHFKDGLLTGIDIVSFGKPFYLSVNGVTVGMDKDSALRTLKIDGKAIEDGATLTLNAAEEDGGWTAEIEFSDGFVKRIKLRK